MHVRRPFQILTFALLQNKRTQPPLGFPLNSALSHEHKESERATELLTILSNHNDAPISVANIEIDTSC